MCYMLLKVWSVTLKSGRVLSEGMEIDFDIKPVIKELNAHVNSNSGGLFSIDAYCIILIPFYLSPPAGGGMSLSPVTGTEVPETANGVVTPVSSGIGPQIPASAKGGGSRVPCSGDQAEDPGNYVDVESGVYDGDGCLGMYNHERTSGPPSLVSRVIGDSEICSRGIPKDSAAESPGAAPPRDPAFSHQRRGRASSNRQQTVTEKLQESTDSPEEEDDDGEKEKQDEEEDEKNDSKWIQPHAVGRTEVGEL